MATPNGDPTILLPNPSASSSKQHSRNGSGATLPNDEMAGSNAEAQDGGKNKRVAYYYDPDVGNYSYGIGHPMKPHRMRMTHNLVLNYGMLEDMQIYRPTRANKTQLTRFHTDEYIDLLEKVMPETAEELTGGGTRCLTGDDCPAFEGLFEFCSISAGGSIGAAERLNDGTADIAINWAGGLHHAKKTEASGFCYVNDIVLGILELLRHHPRVLYIDVDVHHGDGVEEAFYSTDRVMTASFHKFGDFFPGTGDVKDTGIKAGKNYSVNIPLRDGINDQSFHSIFKPVIQHIMDWYQPTVVVLQCGADSLAGDKLGCFNVSLQGHGDCARFVKSFGVPTMVLGGGGYTTKNVARAWTNETAIMIGKELNEDLPYNHYMDYYGPRFKMEVPSNNMEDYNSRAYLDSLLARVTDNLRNMPFAPSAQVGPVPSQSVGQAIGLGNSVRKSEVDIDFELDARIDGIVKAQNQSEDDMDDSEDEAAYPRSNNLRSSRRQQGLSAFKNGKALAPVGKSAARKGSAAGKQPMLEGGYDTMDPFDPINMLKANMPGMDHASGGPRKKRSFFRNSGLPPLKVELTGKIGTNGKAGHQHAAKMSAIRSALGDRGEGVSRSRVGSPVA